MLYWLNQTRILIIQHVIKTNKKQAGYLLIPTSQMCVFVIDYNHLWVFKRLWEKNNSKMLWDSKLIQQLPFLLDI